MVVVVVVTREEEGGVMHSFQVSAVSYQKFIEFAANETKWHAL